MLGENQVYCVLIVVIVVLGYMYFTKVNCDCDVEEGYAAPRREHSKNFIKHKNTNIGAENIMYWTNNERKAFNGCKKNKNCRGVVYTPHDDRYYLKSGEYDNFKKKFINGQGATPGVTSWLRKACYPNCSK